MSEHRRPLPWFRLYSELLRNPEFQALPATEVKHLVNLWCLANETEPRGSLPPGDAVAFHLRISVGRAAALLNRLRELGFLATDAVLGRLVVADQRMYPASDNVTQRVADWRAKQDGKRYTQRFNQQERNVTSNTDVTLASSSSSSSGAESPFDPGFEKSDLVTEEEEEEKQRYMQRFNDGEASSIERAQRHLQEAGIAGGKTPQFEQMLAESGIDCVLHCVDEAVLHNKLSLAYVEQVRRRHAVEGCPPEELSTRLERTTGRRRY